MKKCIDGNFPPLTEKHVLLLQAYKQELNKSQARDAIYECTGRELNFGRYILPLTQELIERGYVKRTNPNGCSKTGHNHIITPEGEEVVRHYLEQYSQMLESISKWKPQPKFGF